jgi:hypothetical protein
MPVFLCDLCVLLWQFSAFPCAFASRRLCVELWLLRSDSRLLVSIRGSKLSVAAFRPLRPQQNAAEKPNVFRPENRKRIYVSVFLVARAGARCYVSPVKKRALKNPVFAGPDTAFVCTRVILLMPGRGGCARMSRMERQGSVLNDHEC